MKKCSCEFWDIASLNILFLQGGCLEWEFELELSIECYVIASSIKDLLESEIENAT